MGGATLLVDLPHSSRFLPSPVVDSGTGRVTCEMNADQMFGPAPVAKLDSTAAAFVDLGPDYGFRTQVVRKGNVDKDGFQCLYLTS